MSKSLRNIHSSKPRSSSTNYISLHFNKADEEQLEISYGENSELSEQEEISNEDLNKLLQSESAKSSDKTAFVVANDNIDEKINKNKPFSKDSSLNRDSVVKDYWSRLSKRASSLDSDLAISDRNSDQNEGWVVFKDIKGKLSKTLEERKQKDISKGPGKSESLSSLSKEVDFDSSSLDAEKVEDKRIKLSPAVEALDGDKIDTDFESYVDGKLENVKCEIFSAKEDKCSLGSKLDLSTAKPYTSENKYQSTPKQISCNSPHLDVEKSVVEGDDEIVLQNSDLAVLSWSNYILEARKVIKNFCISLKFYWNSLLSRIVIAIIALCLVPVPSWFSGFIAGAFLSGYIVYNLLKTTKPKDKHSVPEFRRAPLGNDESVTEANETVIHKGWMNELPSDVPYNPETYHVNSTRSVYVRLDGSYLRISYPQTNIPKRAMYNEPHYNSKQFIYQQHYDITAATVELLPAGLAKKRLWSKKYPLCLTIPNCKQSILSGIYKDTSEQQTTPKASIKKDSPVKKLTPRINENNEVILILFSRTDRDKDLWYYRFKTAARMKLLKNHSPLSSPDISGRETQNLENKRTLSADFNTLLKEDLDMDDFVDLSLTKEQKFELYMTRLLSPLRSDPFLLGTKDKKTIDQKASSVSLNSMSWLNILIGRLFYDFLSEDVWAQCVAEKIRKKLSKLKLPVFLTELSIKDINLGTALPKIHQASEPTVDHRGVWIDIDLSYNGSFQMTLETKINLLRYRGDPDELSLSDVSKGSESINQVLRSPVYNNSEEEDSAESSSDEDFPAREPSEMVEESSTQAAGGSTGKKILRLVDRFAQSSYFQNAAKNKFIKKAMEDISNTPLVLTVEVQWLAGTLALNIPPMPTDRLWYGFRTNPYLSIVARPKLGHHAVTLTHITEWIERKLVLEFQKLLVMPNMDDLIIPIMQPDLDLPKS